jgi:hypothetical protein
MTRNPALPDLACHLRRLLEAVKEACGMEGRRGWLTWPVALLMWIRTRRMRNEAAAALEQFKTLVEQFLALLEDFRAGKLTAPATPEVRESPRSSAAKIPGRAERRAAQRGCQAPDAEMIAELAPSRPTRTRIEVLAWAHPPPRPSPSVGEGLTVHTLALWAGMLTLRARPPPSGRSVRKSRSGPQVSRVLSVTIQ